MTPKAIAVTIGLVILVYVAGKPLGAVITDIGNALVTVGHSVQQIGHG